MNTVLKSIDTLPSAQAFLQNFITRKTLQLFSGEGESLILTKWLMLHGIEFDGLFCVTKYGKFWKIHEEAKRKWLILGKKNLNYIITKNADRATLFYFGHNLSTWGESRVYYNANPSVIEFTRRKGYYDIVMGFRRDDISRHFSNEKDFIKTTTKAFNKEIAKSGQVPTETDCNIWFPLYDLNSSMKDKLLHYLPNF